MPSLRALAGEYDVAAVYTQPDRPAGRGLQLTPTPVKAEALRLGLSVRSPERLDVAVTAEAAGLKPEAIAVVSYGKILPASLLESASLAALNVHPSLLPLYRGATPIQAALRDGCDVTGVSVIWMAAKMDAGDIALARSVDIAAEDTYGTLHERLARLGATLLSESLRELAAGRLPRTAQDESKATYTKPLRNEDRRLNLDADAKAVVNHVRSLSPKPAVWATIAGTRIKVLAAHVALRAKLGNEVPGTILGVDGDALVVACRTGAVRLIDVVPEGKPQMKGAAFAALLK